MEVGRVCCSILDLEGEAASSVVTSDLIHVPFISRSMCNFSGFPTKSSYKNRLKKCFIGDNSAPLGHCLSDFDVGIPQTVLLYLIKGGSVAGAKSEE
jgi:hypothetical protein